MENQQHQNGSKKLIAIIVAALVILAAAIGVIVSRNAGEQKPEVQEVTQAPIVTEEAAATAEPAADAPEEAATAEPETATTGAEGSADDVMALVNGEAITRAKFEDYRSSLIDYFSQLGYDMTNEDNLSIVGSMALDTIIEDTVLNQKAIDLGLDITDEERAQAEADSAAEWAEAVDYYVTNFYGITAESTEEEAAEARLNALALLESMGFTESTLMENAIASLRFEKIYAYMVQGAEVTDEDIQAAFDAHVAEDQATFENDIGYYEFQTQYYGATSYYTPAGYRGVTHILLEVDQALLDEWQSLTARLEEQQEEVDEEDVDLTAEEASPTDLTDDEATQTDLEAPVTQEQVDAAYAAIIASVQPTIDEIMAKLESGTPFADLVAEYGTDPGMTVEPNKTDGYPVHMDSIVWDPAFVAGAFSVDEVGAVAAPVVGNYGVHIIQYTRDVPAGPVAMTDEIRAALTDEVLQSKESELYQTAMEGWLAETDIVYSDEAQAIVDASNSMQDDE